MNHLKKLDEREHLIRGRVFQRSVILLAIFYLLGLGAFKLGFQWIDAENLVVLSLCGMAASVIMGMAVKGVFPVGWKRQAALTVVLGICGVMMVCVSVYEVMTHSTGFVSGVMLNEEGTLLVCGTLFVVTTLVFFISSYVRKKTVSDN